MLVVPGNINDILIHGVPLSVSRGERDEHELNRSRFAFVSRFLFALKRLHYSYIVLIHISQPAPRADSILQTQNSYHFLKLLTLYFLIQEFDSRMDLY